MLKILVPVDGSESAARATASLVNMLAWYKEPPQIDLLSVHLAIPNVRRIGSVVGKEAIDSYYKDECDSMLAPSKKILDAAGVKYKEHWAIGPVAETIVAQASQLDSSMIFMGTRGLSALSGMVVGSIATKVLHLAHVPVLLAR